MKCFRTVTLVIFVLLIGCSTSRYFPEEQAADVPRLTRVMHAATIRMHYTHDKNLTPEDVQQVFAKVIDENPAMIVFKSNLKQVKCCGGEIVLLLCDPETGNALFEDVSCTPSLDQRWYESNNPPQNFTISHPETCDCGEK